MKKTQTHSQVKEIYVDNPNILETFSDSINGLMFDGQTMRIEFCVTRFGQPKPGNPPVTIKTTVSRLVLNQKGFLEFYNQLQNLMGVLEKQGIFKRDIPTPTTVN
jgi:hypothetical protein